MNKKYIVIALLVITFGGAGFLLYSNKEAPLTFRGEKSVTTIDGLNQSGCLKYNEYADYPRKYQGSLELTKPASIPTTTVSVYNKTTKEKINEFEIDGISGSGHSVELHQCGVYVLHFLNYNPGVAKQGPGFSPEFWKFNYEGKGTKLLGMIDYSYDFRIDSKEQYLSLIRGYGGAPVYEVVIKDLQTLEELFVLPVKDIYKQNPDVVGDIGFDNAGWDSSGRYFWFNVFQGADVAGFVRIDTTDWTYVILPAPFRTMGGDAFNIESGMVTYGEDVAPWTGVFEVNEIIREEALQTRQVSSFYVYDLFAKEKYLLATTTDPTYYFRPQWMSSTELNYYLPSGQVKIFTTKKQ